jgi:hypothetical protein
MVHEVTRLYQIFGLILVLAVAGFFLRILLAVILRNRFAPGLMPGLTDPQPQAFLLRVLALVGLGAAPRVTLGVVRLRATLGLRLMYLGLLVAMIAVAQAVQAALISLETLLVLVVAAGALRAFLLEVSYDRDTITLPRWGLGHSTHRWADLLALRTNDPWFLTFHFEKGVTVRVNKYLVGYRGLLETARKAMRET